MSIVVAVLVLVTYWPVLSAGAVTLDDGLYLFENPVLQHPSWKSAGVVFREVLQSSTVEGYYEPLTLLSLMLDVALGGRSNDLTPFHATNLALHVLNTFLIIVFLHMLFGKPWVAVAIGLLFGIHPLTVEPVAWVWERKTVLATFFALWCLILYLRYARRPGRALYAAILVMVALALMAKPTVTPLPLLLLLLDFWPLRRLSKRAVLEKVPFFVIAAISGIITVISTHRTGDVTLAGEHSLGQVPLKICYLIVFYLSKIVWPANLSSVYVLPEPMALSQPLVLGGALGTCVLIALLVVSLCWTRAALVGWLFFIVAISPMLGVIGYSWIVASDKYVYLPAIGLLLAIASFLAWLWSGPPHQSGVTLRRFVTLAVVLVLCGLEGRATRVCLTHWRDSETRIRYMLTLTPEVAALHDQLGNILNQQDKLEEAVVHLDEAIRLNPASAQALNNRATVYGKNGDYEQAIVLLDRAIKLRPNNPRPYHNRARAYYLLGQYDKAWADVSMLRQVGGTPHPDFLRELNEATGRTQ